MVWLNSGMTISGHDDQWGETDSMEHDFSVEEILDMPTVSEVQPDPTPKVTDSDLKSEDGESETFGITNSNTLHLECNETVFPSSVKRNDLELIDIESLFIEDTDDRPVLSQDEAWELFS